MQFSVNFFYFHCVFLSLDSNNKFNVDKIIESSKRCFHKNVKRGLIPHPTTITRLCILARVKGIWAEEETCPKKSFNTDRGDKRPKEHKEKRDGDCGSGGGA